MSIYGIDLHSDRITVATMVVTEDRVQEKLATFIFKEESYQKFLSSLRSDDYALIENSTNAFWFYDQVAPRIKACFVYDTNDIRSSGNKNDKIDARHLARKLSYYLLMGAKKEDLPTVHIPDAEIRELRGLVYDLPAVQQDEGSDEKPYPLDLEAKRDLHRSRGYRPEGI